MANNYLKSTNNPFGLPNENDYKDVDDELFLQGSRRGSNGPNYSSGRSNSTNPFEDLDDQHLMYAQKRREIENRTLESTEKSLSLLYETEEAGKETALELAKQREQLERTARHIDDINSTLRFSQRHLNNLKSVFGGLKNYLAGNREQQAPPPLVPRLPLSPSELQQDRNFNETGASSSATTHRGGISPSERFDNFSTSRTHDMATGGYQQQQQRMPSTGNAFDAQLESNLENMCENLSRLKYLATDLGAEIESQNILLDNMNYKIEDVDIKIRKQNKDINKLLK